MVCLSPTNFVNQIIFDPGEQLSSFQAKIPQSVCAKGNFENLHFLYVHTRLTHYFLNSLFIRLFFLRETSWEKISQKVDAALSQRGINGVILANKTVQFDRLVLINSPFAQQTINPLFFFSLTEDNSRGARRTTRAKCLQEGSVEGIPDVPSYL